MEKTQVCPLCNGSGKNPFANAETEASVNGGNIVGKLLNLTKREMDILEHLLIGNTLQQIAILTGTSYNTVRNQRKKLLKKMGVDSDMQLLCQYVHACLGRPLPSPRTIIEGQ